MKTLIASLFLLSLAAPAVALAAPTAESGFDKDLQDKRMRTLRTVGLAEMLNLSEADALKLSETLRPFDEQRRPLREQIKSAAQVLRQAAQGDSIPSAQVDDAANKIFDARTQLAAIDRAQFAAITKGMSSQDRAKVAVYFAKFQQHQHHAGGPTGDGPHEAP
jgi:Spy/CpxP family protein refolding chaperone